MTEHKFVVKLVCYLSDEPEVLTEINFATRKRSRRIPRSGFIRYESEIR